MNSAPISKLKISNYLMCKNIPCMPEYDSRAMITKLAALTKYKKDISLLEIDGDNVVMLLSDVIDDFGEITRTDLAKCLYDFSRKSKKHIFSNQKWRDIRYKALKISKGACCLCGHTAKDGVKLSVDHIKPKSLYPHLQYELSNLQVLCEDCNLGKANKDDTDWR